MGQISASELRDIATDISNELDRLRQLEAEIELVQAEIAKQPSLAPIFYESLALKFHNFYTGCERIFQIVASEFNGKITLRYGESSKLIFSGSFNG